MHTYKAASMWGASLGPPDLSLHTTLLVEAMALAQGFAIPAFKQSVKILLQDSLHSALRNTEYCSLYKLWN